MRAALKSFDNNQIGRSELCQYVFQRRFRLATQFVNQRPAPARSHQNLARPRSAVHTRILPRLIDIEFVVRMFHRGDFQAPAGKNRNDLGNQRRFAGSAPAGETDDAHAHGRYDRDAWRLLRPSMTEKLIDLRGLKCPLPVLRTRKALAACAPGDIVVVQCTDPLAAIDIPYLLGQTGDAIEETRREQGVTTLRIRKRLTPPRSSADQRRFVV